MQGLSLPTCLLKIPCWVYRSTMKRQTASIHTQVCVHTTNTYADSKCPKDNVTNLIAAAVLALSCVCVWQTGSPCAQTHTIGSPSHRIIVSVCVCVCVGFWVCACFVSICLSVTAGTCLTSWYWLLLSVRGCRDGGRVTRWETWKGMRILLPQLAKRIWNVLFDWSYFSWDQSSDLEPIIVREFLVLYYFSELPV